MESGRTLTDAEEEQKVQVEAADAAAEAQDHSQGEGAPPQESQAVAQGPQAGAPPFCCPCVLFAKWGEGGGR